MLTQIPLDILELIVYENPWKTIPSLTQTCKILYRRLRGSHEKYLSPLRVFLREIQTYLKEVPHTFGLWRLESDRGHINATVYHLAFRRNGNDIPSYSENSSYIQGLMIPHQCDAPHHYDVSYENYAYESGGELVVEESSITQIMCRLINYDTAETTVDDIWELPQVDLVTQYRIYAKRLGCVKRNPRYALEKVLDTFDMYYDDYKRCLPSCRVLSRRASLVFLMHGYLYLHGCILNMVPNLSIINIGDYVFSAKKDSLIYVAGLFGSPGEALDSLENETEKMEKEIEVFVRKIRRRLELLPLTEQ